ncbi:hypothetical protein DL96DRAFT_1681635 [Flagelloscypha sp. PMI_526]|nr:hypothetical protein DL96DRAFT_1681635 [Flagelloscypha sp. PMI_526]
MLLVELPQDILIDCICTLLSPADTFTLLQTCRNLNHVLQSPHLWQRLRNDSDLPLDPLQLSGNLSDDPQVIQRALLRALHVDYRFTQAVSMAVPKQVSVISGFVIQFELIPGKDWDWLVCLSCQNATAGVLTCWCLTPTVQHLLVTFDVSNPTKISASYERNTSSLRVAVLSETPEHHAHLDVYEIGANTEVDPLVAPGFVRTLATVRRAQAVFFAVFLRGHFVATGVTSLNNGNSSILLLNLSSLETTQLESSFHAPPWSITDTRLYITKSCDEAAQIEIDVFELSDLSSSHTLKGCLDLGEHDIIPTQNLVPDAPALPPDFQVPRIPEISYLTVQELCNVTTTTLLFEPLDVAAHPTWKYGRRKTITSQSGSNGSINQLGSFSLVHSVLTSADTTASIMCIGSTGKRAVWLERTIETNEFRLMKTTFSENGSVTSPLLPAGMVLPFRLDMCNAMFYHEGKGIVLLGLYTGLIYSLTL